MTGTASAAGIGLDDRQREAVEHPDGPVLVLAGPGAGKTRVIAHRIAHLLEREKDRVDAGRILALTFSRRAVEELRSRMAGGVSGGVSDGSSQVPRVRISTFHSFSLALLRRHATARGEAPPQILPTREQWMLVRELLAGHDPREWGFAEGAFDRKGPLREVYDLLLRVQEDLLEPEDLRDLGEKTGCGHLVPAARLLEDYRGRLREKNSVDYEAVIRRAVELLSEDEVVRAGAGVPYEHVLVDEFQDTNRSQMDLLKRLVPQEDPNVFCVGDDDQSVYGFRGARIENLRRFGKEDFPGAKTVELRTNYRSGTGILNVAGDVIVGDGGRLSKEKQKTPSEEGTDTVLYEVCPSPREEGAWISDRIIALNRGPADVPLGQIVILRRSLLGIKPLVEALASRGIPLDVSAVPEGLTATHLADLLQAAVPPHEDPDPTTASRTLASPVTGLDAGAAGHLRTVAAATDRTVFGLIRDGIRPESVPEEEFDRAREAVAAVDAARSEGGLLGKVYALRDGLPGVRDLFERHEKDAEAARALQEVVAFLRSAEAYARVARRPNADGFLKGFGTAHDEDSDTWASSPLAEDPEDVVRVMTVHGAKGLESEAVFVSGLVEDEFPARSRGDRLADALRDDPEAPAGPSGTVERERRRRAEERRLLYVAVTRAKRYLFLTGIEEVADEGAKASPFLKELEERLTQLAPKVDPLKPFSSHREAIEELRRAACDTGLPEPSRFAASRALVRLGEGHPTALAHNWWRHREKTGAEKSKPAFDARDLVEHFRCPRRAFLERVSAASRGSSGGLDRGRMLFGQAFQQGLGRFMRGECDSLREAVREAVREKRFGGASVEGHWLRAVDDMGAGVERWAEEVRESLVSPGGEWEEKIGDRTLRGRHGPVVRTPEGATVVLRVTTGKSATSAAEAAESIDLMLDALASGADEARFVYVRQPKANGAPTERFLATPDGWRELGWAAVAGALGEMASGPPKRTAEEERRLCRVEGCTAHGEESSSWMR